MKVKCPKATCGKTLNVPQQYVGRKVRCPACSQVFRLGKPAEAQDELATCSQCGGMYVVAHDAAGTFQCPECRAAAQHPVPMALPVEPVAQAPAATPVAGLAPAAGPAEPPVEAPPAPAPEYCPVCGHKLGRNPKKCIYCGADVTMSMDDPQMTGVDVVAGVSVHLLSAEGAEVLAGTMRARDDGLHVWGYPPGAHGGGGSAVGELGTRVAVSVALTALAAPTLGVFFMPKLTNLGDQQEGPQSIEVVLPWDRIQSIENLGDRIQISALKEVQKLLRKVTETETFNIVLDTGSGANQLRCHALYDQLVKYKENPSVMPHCPGCDRVVKSDTRKCIYCGATW